MNLEDAEEYTQALGQVVAGGWRQIALGERLGVPEALGMTTRDWVDKRLGGYVRLSIPERREAVHELVVAEGMTQRQAADVLGVGKDTVRRDVGANAPTETSGSTFEEESGANAPADSERIAGLPDDLAVRVGDGVLPLDEAELIHAQNERQLDEWAGRIRDGLTTLRRMAGHPVPGGIRSRLTDEEFERLVAVLNILTPLLKEVDAA